MTHKRKMVYAAGDIITVEMAISTENYSNYGLSSFLHIHDYTASLRFFLRPIAYSWNVISSI